MSFSEKRRHPRAECEDVTVDLYTSENSHDPEIYDICPIINLSESGMKIGGMGNSRPGDQLRLTFVLPESVMVIRTDAEVVHVQKDQIGVRFTRIEEAERKLIRHFVGRNIRRQTHN